MSGGRLNTIDPALETAINDLRCAVRRHKRGRVILALEILDGRITWSNIDEDLLTDRELDNLMRQPPQKGKHVCR